MRSPMGRVTLFPMAQSEFSILALYYEQGEA